MGFIFNPFYRVKYAKTTMLARCKFPQYLTGENFQKALSPKQIYIRPYLQNAVGIGGVAT